MISVDNFNAFMEAFCRAHDCVVQILDDLGRPICKVLFEKNGREHKFEMPLRQNMSLDDLGLIFHDEWEKSGFDNETIVTKEPGSPDAGEDWYNRIAANPDISDPMAAYEKIDAIRKGEVAKTSLEELKSHLNLSTDICPFCNPNPGPEEATDLVSIEDGELRSSTWIDFHEPDGPKLYSCITFLDGNDRCEHLLKFNARKINFCPMCGRKIREE